MSRYCTKSLKQPTRGPLDGDLKGQISVGEGNVTGSNGSRIRMDIITKSSIFFTLKILTSLFFFIQILISIEM